MLTLRIAEPTDENWINTAYQQIQFQPSNFKQEVLVVAEWDGIRAGVGRLVPVSDNACELGGMLVLQPFRGKGIARRLVTALLNEAGTKAVFCIPFEHLIPFYQSFGFDRVTSCQQLPAALQCKLDWCQTTYEQQTTVLVLKK